MNITLNVILTRTIMKQIHFNSYNYTVTILIIKTQIS
jgi:hypothetical protein